MKKEVLVFGVLLLFLNLILASSLGVEITTPSGTSILDFLDLTDTPSSYVGEGTNCVVVNAGENALEFGNCGGAGAGDKWVDNGTYISPNSSFANDIFVHNIYSLDWTNVTITESQISDLSHTGSKWNITTSEYMINSSGILDVNETQLNNTIDSRIAVIFYNATNISTIFGTNDGGNLASLHVIKDGDSYNISESAGANPLTVTINFTGVNSVNVLRMREQYTGTTGHELSIGLFHCTNEDYEEEFGDITSMASFATVDIVIPDPSNHVCSNNVSVRIRHVQNGNPAHNLFIEYMVLIEGNPAGSNIKHDGLTERDEISNHPWALDINGTRNMTMLNVTGNISATNINAKTNYSNVQNHPSMTDTFNSTDEIFGVCDNSSFIKEGTQLGNTTLEIWNVANNDSFYSITNPNGFFNISDFDINDYSTHANVNANSSGNFNSTDEIFGVVDNSSFIKEGTQLGNTTLQIQTAINNSGLYNLSINYSNVQNHPSMTDTFNSTDEIFGVVDNSSFEKLGKGYYNSSLLNTTVLEEQNGGVLGFVWSGFLGMFNSIFGTKDTDDLSEGSTNKYDNVSFNQTLTDELYSSGNFNSTDEIFGVVDNSSFIKVGTQLGNTTNEIFGVVDNSSFLKTEVNWNANFSSNVTCNNFLCTSNITWNGSHTLWY